MPEKSRKYAIIIKMEGPNQYEIIFERIKSPTVLESANKEN
jgi:hypothetical protein